jgi:hypothetical protein
MVTFIDILGFKNAVETKDIATVKGILERFRLRQKQKGKIYIDSLYIKDATLDVAYFSDSIIRIRYLDVDNPSDHWSGYKCDDSLLKQKLITEELRTLETIQNRLFFEDGILIRGGSTIGDIYYEKNTGVVFGDALNTAYGIERESSIDPRIVVDPKICREGLGDETTTSLNKKVYDLCAFDEHGLRWINYFSYSIFETLWLLIHDILCDDAYEEEVEEERNTAILNLNENIKLCISRFYECRAIPPEERDWGARRIAMKHYWCYNKIRETLSDVWRILDEEGGWDYINDENKAALLKYKEEDTFYYAWNTGDETHPLVKDCGLPF